MLCYFTLNAENINYSAHGFWDEKSGLCKGIVYQINSSQLIINTVHRLSVLGSLVNGLP